MRLRLLYILLLAVLSLVATDKVVAQNTFVWNAVVEVADIEFKYGKSVKIFAYNNAKDANEEISALKYGGKGKLFTADTNPNEYGEFQIEVQDLKEAVVLIWSDGYSPMIVEKKDMRPNRRITLNKRNSDESVVGKDGVREKEIVEVTIERSRIRKYKAFSGKNSEAVGVMTSNATFRIPYRIKTNMRVAVQTSWSDRIDITDKRKDSLFSYGSVLYSDEDEYHKTQLRRMDFDINHDSMFYINSISKHYVNSDSVKSEIIFMRDADTIIINLIDTVSGYDPDPSHPYPFGGKVQIVDYNTILYNEYQTTNGERWVPLKFLEFKFHEFLPDSTFFYVPMNDTPNEHGGELKLNFLVGRAIIADNDSANLAQLEKLRETLLNIQTDPKRTLINVMVYGMSSPEGNYASNKALANSRANTVAREISKYTDRPVNHGEAKVAPWEWVADSLAKDGYTSIAEEIRDIVKQHPDNISAQGISIARLSSYGLIKDVYLPKFRVVRYVYTERKLGQKNPVRILEEYRKDPSSLGRAEYWKLLNYLVEDKALLKSVARDALKYTHYDKYLGQKEYNNGYWAYAAALLAHACVATDTIDMKVQEPFLDYRLKKDSVSGKDMISETDIMRDPENRDIIDGYTNGPSMAANQLIMTLQQPKRFYKKHIPILQSLIDGKGAEYDSLLIFSKCMEGKYIGPSAEAQEIRKVVSAVSATNAVVINLAVNDSPESLEAAIADSVNLPDNAISDYLKSIICLRKNDKERAERYLANCFCKDVKYIGIASNDYDLLSTTDSEYHVIVGALTIWRRNMGKYIKNKNRTVKRVMAESVTAQDSTLAEMKIPEDSVKVVQQEIYEEMSEEDFNNHSFVKFDKALTALTDNENNNYKEAVEMLYDVFDKESTYLTILNVFMLRDSNINKDEKMLDKLRSIRDEYVNTK